MQKKSKQPVNRLKNKASALFWKYSKHWSLIDMNEGYQYNKSVYMHLVCFGVPNITPLLS